MKSTALRVCSTVGVLLWLAVASAQAQTATQYRGQIPFAFSVGQETFAAGDYVIELASPQSNQRTLLIRSATGGEARMVPTIAQVPNAKGAPARLLFNRYDQLYFLAEMRTPTLGAKLFKGKVERHRAEQRNHRAPRRETVGLLSH
ncbi:MAG TPA: hypothetical protein VF546_13585 [Pyrinomonadaceae bacterium]|jgi:hypothetical protein